MELVSRLEMSIQVLWFWFDRIKDGHCLVLSVIFWQPMCPWCANATYVVIRALPRVSCTKIAVYTPSLLKIILLILLENTMKTTLI